jgi:4-nitrophenyl phosphatase
MTYRGAVIDVDGTVMRGSEPIPDASEGLVALEDAEIRRLFVSNNPVKAPGEYVGRFERAGLSVSADEVVTAGTVASAYLAERYAESRIFLVGDAGLAAQFEDAGLRLTDNPDAAEVVVASVDREFEYGDLRDALWALSDRSVPFVGTDPDMTIPTETREVPGSGAIIHAVAGVAGRRPDAVLGKPSAPARQMILDRLGVPADECLVVGDRLDTDIALGARAGMTTVLVRTGVTTDADVADADVRPDYVLDSIAEIGDVLSSET